MARMSLETKKKIDDAIFNYQDLVNKYFEKNQKIEFPGQEVPFRFKNSDENILLITIKECDETFIVMKVSYIKEKKVRYFTTGISCIKYRDNPLLILGKWLEMTEDTYKGLVTSKGI